MRRILIALTAFCAAWIALAGCAKAPGEREFDGGVRELKDGNNVRAKALFEKSINRRPGSEANAMAFNYIGIASFRLGQVQEALDAFEDSRRITPTLVEPVYNEGYVLAQSGNAVRAAELLSEAARMDPSDPRPLEVVGQLYNARGQWPEARRALYGALDRAQNSARIPTAIALVELNAGEPEKAVPMLMKALDQDTHYAPALFNLAIIYQQQNDAAKAKTYFERFLDAAETDPRAAYAKAALAKISGEKPLARHDAQSASGGPAPKPPPKSVAVPAAPATNTPAPAPVSPPVKKPPTSVEDMLREASIQADQGHTDRALELCLQAAAKAAEMKKPDLQEKSLRVGVKLCFDAPRAHVALGDFLLAAGKNDAALKAYKQATVLDANSAPAQIGMAQAALATGEVDTALVGLKQAIKSDPKNPDAPWLLAKMYDEEIGNTAVAAQAYRDFARLFPSDPRAPKAQSRAQQLLPKISSPTAPVITATAAPPAEVEAPGEERPPVVENVTTVPVKPGASIKYKKPVARNTKAAVQAFNQGTKFQEKKDWDRAIYYYLRSLENDDMIASTFYNLGVAYGMKGEREPAKDAYLHALEIQPDMSNARYNLALLYRDAADYPSATRLLEEIVRANPNHAPAHYVLGLIYSDNATTYPQAKQHYARFLELAPNDPASHSARTWLETH